MKGGKRRSQASGRKGFTMNKIEDSEKKIKKKKLSPFQIIIFGFAGVLITGAILLMMPISSKNGAFTPFNEALFTSTSAVCVTGLVIHDTAAYWSAFGQAVILVLIQTGGLGVITVAASLALVSGRRISLLQRSIMQEAISASKIGGIVKLTLFILKATLIFEIGGALTMMPVFCVKYGPKGIWMSFFHSISAFCNAGFDIMGEESGQFTSFSSFSSQPLINIVVISLIIIGGIGFLTWEDLVTNKFHVKRYRMQTKIILSFSAILIIIPFVFFFFVDFNGLPLGKRILVSLFQAVTPRTAGFNTENIAAMSGGSKGMIVFLMLTGGAPGSTAGGMKTTTMAVLLLNAIAVIRRKDDSEAFGRRIDISVTRNATALLLMYVFLFGASAIVISTLEGIPVATCLFETASAIGTVGLTLGITPELGVISQVILMLLMFFGRVGGLTLIYAAISQPGNKKKSKLPLERITIG